MKKKLQVFVSSTYQDLIEERQVAVLSIISSGHIPAGMELFTAGDESQWNVIKRWIEESDVFLLILGGRYGSIEPKSGKSYTHLEYEYAIKLNKPHFAVVMKDEYLEKKVKSVGSSVLEKSNPKELRDFKNLVLSKMVKFFNDEKDIKLAIYETMSEFVARKDLIGWVRSNESINSDQVAQQLTILSEENQNLRSQLSTMSNSNNPREQLYNGLNFREILEILSSKKIPPSNLSSKEEELLDSYKNKLKTESRSLLVFLIAYLDDLAKNEVDYFNKLQDNSCKELKSLGLVELKGNDGIYYGFTGDGRKLYLKLLIEYSSIINWE